MHVRLKSYLFSIIIDKLLRSEVFEFSHKYLNKYLNKFIVIFIIDSLSMLVLVLMLMLMNSIHESIFRFIGYRPYIETSDSINIAMPSFIFHEQSL